MKLERLANYLLGTPPDTMLPPGYKLGYDTVSININGATVNGMDKSATAQAKVSSFEKRKKLDRGMSQIEAHLQGKEDLYKIWLTMRIHVQAQDDKLLSQEREIQRLRLYRYNARRATRALQSAYERVRGLVAMKCLDKVVESRTHINGKL